MPCCVGSVLDFCGEGLCDKKHQLRRPTDWEPGLFYADVDIGDGKWNSVPMMGRIEVNEASFRLQALTRC